MPKWWGSFSGLDLIALIARNLPLHAIAAKLQQIARLKKRLKALKALKALKTEQIFEVAVQLRLGCQDSKRFGFF